MPTSPPADPPAARQRVQMADIARAAGVSKATVSRALSDSPLVSDETRARIRALAKSLRYTINLEARNLRRKDSRTVGVVLPFDSDTRRHLNDPFFLGMLGAVADALTVRGYDMLLTRVDAQQTDCAAQPFDTGRAIGIILIGQWRQHAQLNDLAARGVPIVAWGAQLPQQRYTTVGGDNVSGGMLATAHLIAGGRRRIAFFGDINLPEVAQRYRGYCNALAQHALPVDPQLRVSVPFVPGGGAQAVQELVRRAVGFDAIFACSDLLAMEAINTLRGQDRLVPRDVGVVGYDDIVLAAYYHPPLSTIRQPIGAAGELLVTSLLALVDGAQAPSVHLPTELIVRASAA
ncbi:LacI family DNA-binding transcriptional regulator [Massilia sp. PAMC28688]|uniref:LacI family DNA-binding transcriptional regulator n=1 Tax=Massilia sp. PAMC28688 TaxID=2861283 RepID=UPI001C63A6A9|nr:LacI family DNA-binding transcriptional regulator [Massilia sp. PAMC28688]QYF95525.1 LacI family DNA-binding transcriptional regulator [Massilia sp. PAMC28688]